MRSRNGRLLRSIDFFFVIEVWQHALFAWKLVAIFLSMESKLNIEKILCSNCEVIQNYSYLMVIHCYKFKMKMIGRFFVSNFQIHIHTRQLFSFTKMDGLLVMFLNDYVNCFIWRVKKAWVKGVCEKFC